MARKAQWVDTLMDAPVTTGGQLAFTLMGGMAPVDSRGLTATRTIVGLSLVPPTAVSDGVQIVSLGIGVFSQEAFVAGIFPDPNDSNDRPPRGWLWRDRIAVPGAASMVGGQLIRLSSDVRGMRKVDDGELALIVNNDAGDGTTFSVQVIGIVRIVFLLP